MNVQGISLTKYLDALSPVLFRSLVTGTRFTNASVVLTTGDAHTIEYLLENVLVTSSSSGASRGEDRPTENITLAYTKLTLKYDGVSGAWQV